MLAHNSNNIQHCHKRRGGRRAGRSPGNRVGSRVGVFRALRLYTSDSDV